MERDANRRIAEMRGQLQRMNADEEPQAYQELFAGILALEDQRRALQQQALDGGVSA